MSGLLGSAASSARELAEHQIFGLAQLRRAVAAGKRKIMLQAPTGSGKTRTAAEIVRGALAKHRRVMFTLPALGLIDQTLGEFEREGIDDVGVIQAQHERTDAAAPVQIASVQTLEKRKVAPPDVVIVDEAHRWFAVFERLMRDPEWANVIWIGLSATPWSKGLGKQYEELIVVTTTRDLIAKGWLSPFKVYAAAHPNLRGVRTKAGDFHEGDLAKAMNNEALVAEVVSTWLRLGENRPTFVFGVDRAHAKSIQMQFLSAGISAAYIDAFTPLDDRAALKQRFHTGEVKVVCNVGVMTTGIDWDVRCISLARPTKSEILYVQIVGRGLRRAEGKPNLLLLDHSDSTLNLGFVDQIHHSALDNGERDNRKQLKPAARPRECPRCHFLRSPKVLDCPGCAIKPTAISMFGSKTKVSIAELQRDEKSLKKALSTKQRWFSMLLHVARSRGYSRGWISHKFKAKFGDWPQGLVEMSLAPDAEVTRWIRKLNREFVNSQRSA